MSKDKIFYGFLEVFSKHSKDHFQRPCKGLLNALRRHFEGFWKAFETPFKRPLKGMLKAF